MLTIRYCDWTTGSDWSGNGGADNGGFTGALSAWAGGTTYATGNRVYYGTAPTRYVWRSLQDGNTGNTPSEGAWWTLVADGSTTKPFRSTYDAANGLTGGDEVRIAKSPAHTAISQQLTWTHASATVVCTGYDVTSEIAVKEFIGKATAGPPGDWETYYEVTAISYAGGNTTITLLSKYYGDTATVASQKCGTTDTGDAVAWVGVGNRVEANGVSTSNMLLVSGGWDLSTGLRTGETWLLNSGATKTFAGVHLRVNAYVKLQHVGSLRYLYGFMLQYSSVHTITDCTASGVGGYGVLFSSAATDCTVSNNALMGTVNASYGVAISTSTMIGNVVSGNLIGGSYQGIATEVRDNTYEDNFIMDAGHTGIITSASNQTFTGNTTSHSGSGVALYGSNTTLSNHTATDNVYYGVAVVSGPSRNVFSNLVVSNNGTADIKLNATTSYGEGPTVVVQRLNGVAGADYQYFENGTTQRDSTTYHDASPSLKFSPTSATIYIRQDLIGPGTADTDHTLGIYLMKSATFNGSVQLEAYNSTSRLVTGPTTAAVTDVWAQYTMTIAAADMPCDGTVMLRIRVRGTAGNVWADDFSVE